MQRDKMNCPVCGGFIEFDMLTECGSCDTCFAEMKNGEIIKKKDFSDVCTHDDDNDPHCFNCLNFVFPIGCMEGEV